MVTRGKKFSSTAVSGRFGHKITIVLAMNIGVSPSTGHLAEVTQ